MTNGINKFEIQLDNPTATFSPGEIIQGKVIIELSRKKNLRALKLRFKGACIVQWTESRGSGKDKQTIHYNETELYFRTDLCLFGSEAGDSVEMSSGPHVFPFYYNLPRNIPSSFEHNFGNVRYSIKAIFDRPWKFDHTTIKFLTIETPFELEPSNHHANIGIDDDVKENYCCLLPCINRGYMTLKFQTPTTIFSCGDAIQTTIIINNKSDSVDVTKIKLKLEQKLQFYIKARNKVKRANNIVQSTKKSGPFTKEMNVQIGLQVPTLPHSNFKYCSLIDVNYCLNISVHVSGCHCSTKKSYDIVIGSRSALSSTMTIQSNAVPSAPPIYPEQNSTGHYPIPVPSINHNFPSSNTTCPDLHPEFSMLANNPAPYPTTIHCNFPYPPETIHQPLPNIGFVYPHPTSSNNTIEPPPSYDDAIAGSEKKTYK